ncbi:hypothetical protein [Xanthomonas oryzae]
MLDTLSPNDAATSAPAASEHPAPAAAAQEAVAVAVAVAVADKPKPTVVVSEVKPVAPSTEADKAQDDDSNKPRGDH